MPFLIDDHGVSVLPITSLGLAHQASTAHVSTGIAGLDAMFGKKGYFRGNSVLVSGTAGTGKSSLAAHFADGRVPAGRALPVLRLRGVAEPDHAQHAVDRHRPRALDAPGPAARPRPAADGPRPGSAPGRDAPADRRLAASGGRRGPGHQHDRGRQRDRSEGHARAAHRFHEAPADHRALHLPDRGGRRGRADRPRRVVVDGRLDAAREPGSERRAQPGDPDRQGPGHGALEPGARVRDDRPRHHAGGRQPPGRRKRGDRVGPGCPATAGACRPTRSRAARRGAK